MSYATSLVLLCWGMAQADETDACAGVCPDGQRTVAHADGENTYCYCGDESSGMQATVVDASNTSTDLDAGQSAITDASSVQRAPEDEPNPDVE